jgi:hypothetical protein
MNKKEKEYTGWIYEAKDNIVVEKRTGEDSVSISAPIDFVDGCLREFVDKEVKITITITVESI